jgi:hypothetical protein
MLESLGSDVLRPVHTPVRTAHRIERVELLDLADPRPVPPGTILLGIGLRLGPGLEADLAHCEQRGADLVVLKTHRADLAEDVVGRVGITLLVAGDGLDWMRLRDLIERALAGADPRQNVPAISGGDLFGLANAVATLTGGAVAIFDTEKTVVAYSTLEEQPIDETRRQGILGREVPEEALDYYNQAFRSVESVRIERPGDLPRLGLAVRAGHEVLGSLWVAQPEFVEPSPATRAALLEAAGICAVHLLRLREYSRREFHQRNRAFQDVLTEGATVNGTDLALPGRIVALLCPKSTVGHRIDALAVVDLLELGARGFGLTVGTATLGQLAFALVANEGSAPDRFGTYVEHVRTRVRNTLRASRFCVVSEELEHVSALRTAVTDIRTAFDYAEDILRPDTALELSRSSNLDRRPTCRRRGSCAGRAPLGRR